MQTGLDGAVIRSQPWLDIHHFQQTREKCLARWTGATRPKGARSSLSSNSSKQGRIAMVQWATRSSRTAGRESGQKWKIREVERVGDARLCRPVAERYPAR
jgi:hypothetical protein